MATKSAAKKAILAVDILVLGAGKQLWLNQLVKLLDKKLKNSTHVYIF